jgi:hypothetical protein
MRAQWLACRLLAASAGVFVAGCSGSEGTVSGKVTAGGKAVTAGAVSVIPTSTGIPLTSEIAADGSYAVANVPYGEAIVCVSGLPEGGPLDGQRLKKAADPEARSAPAKGADRGQPPPPAAKGMLPSKYADQATTDLRCKVDQRTVEFHIDLK